uniref:Uncharacterized protein n=1 Tax=Hemiselmis tepida TaxID=464990 RepID=A0A7S0W2T5_9CRYP
MEVRWTGFRQYVGEFLQANPRSDDDALLMDYIYSEEVIAVIAECEYKFRRAYKRLLKQNGKIPKWEDLAITHRYMKMDQNSVQKFLRDLVPKELGGPIRQEDWSTALRASNHESTSKETSGKTSGEATLPELMEMIFRCAMGGTGVSWAMRDETDTETEKRHFDQERDGPAEAADRIRVLLEFVWDWLESERKMDDKESEDHTVLMEECPLYDTAHTDLQMIFMHFCTDEPYSESMDYSNPMLTMPSTTLFRFCAAAGFMDSRVTYTAIYERYTSLAAGKGPWEKRSINYSFFCRLLSGLARIKYEEARSVVAITMLLEQWLVPMVNLTIPSTELMDFLFTQDMLSFFLIYETHIGKMFDKHATTREVILTRHGVVETPGSVAPKALEEPHRRIKRAVVLDEEEEQEASSKSERKQSKIMTLIDFNSFLKALRFVPDMLTVEEVPEVFDAVVNSTPHLQMAINDASMCLSQLLQALTSCALIMYSRPPYSSKYATREEKVLATMERVEVTYYTMFTRFMPLEPVPNFPAMDWKLTGMTKESQLREFLIARRLQRGMSLVAVTPKAHLLGDTEGTISNGAAAQRQYAPIPERADGKRTVSLGMPSIVREQLFAPEAPYPVGPLMETALIHHNAARYKAAVETYLQALNTWNSMVVEAAEQSRLGGTAGTLGSTARSAKEAETGDDPPLSPQKDDEQGLTLQEEIDDVQLLFFFISLGGVYESAGLDELALASYTEGRLIGDRVKGAEMALAYSATGNVLFHLGQHTVALSFFQTALKIREAAIGERHMDTGLLYNNIGACYDLLDRVTEATESYGKARDVFQFEFGLTHPRTATAMRNLGRVKQRRFDFHVSFAQRHPTPCPAKLLGGEKKKKGKKGKKGGGKGKKKK